MDSFSVASLTSLCAAISQHAVSSTAEIQGLVQSLNSVDEYTQAIATLATAFQETEARASKLDQSLAQASVISERLQRILIDALSSCNSVSARLHKQVMRVHAENIARLNIKYIHGQHGILTAFTALFQFLAEVLLMYESCLTRASASTSLLTMYAATREMAKMLASTASKHKSLSNTHLPRHSTLPSQTASYWKEATQIAACQP